MLRRLRIAASVFFAVMAVALCVLWVRSYFVSDWVWVQKSKAEYLVFCPVNGRIAIDDVPPSMVRQERQNRWVSHARASVESMFPIESKAIGVGWFELGNGPAFFVSYWLLTLLAATASASCWLPWHFSVRTLLLATTLIAVVLGLVVWAAR